MPEYCSRIYTQVCNERYAEKTQKYTSFMIWQILHVPVTLVQGHDTSLDLHQQMYKVISGSKKAVKTNSPDTIFDHAYAVTFTSEMWTWVKVMAYPWVVENNLGRIIQIQIQVTCQMSWPVQ